MTSRKSSKSEPVPEALEAVAVVLEQSAASSPEEPIASVESMTATLEEEAPSSVVGTAADAIRHGAASAKAAVGEIIPGAGRLVRKSVYGTFYCASYGVVFAALTVARLVPTNNAMGEGLRDGAVAARKAVEEELEVSEEAAAETAEPVLA